MGRVKITDQTESALITTGCFFAACRNGNSSHSCGHIRFDQHRFDILFPLLTGVLVDVEVLDLYDVI